MKIFGVTCNLKSAALPFQPNTISQLKERKYDTPVTYYSTAFR